MEQVADMQGYVEKMEKSLLDKLFFIDKIWEPIETVLDFGCANGVLIRSLQQLFPEYRYVGYDISQPMIARAKEICPDTEFYTIWEEIPITPSSTLLNISSTLHEVYAYGTKESIAEFWNRVWNTGFGYIAIRDMMVSSRIPTQITPEEQEKVQGLYPEKLAQYQEIWGPVKERFHLIHYLLKYRYTENWEREVRENYLPISTEQLLSLIPDTYEIVYKEHYLLPFIGQQIYKDCGIRLKEATHFKLLLKRKVS